VQILLYKETPFSYHFIMRDDQMLAVAPDEGEVYVIWMDVDSILSVVALC
jgi:hypothetical protein